MDLAEMDTRLRAAELLVAEAAEAVGRGEAAVRARDYGRPRRSTAQD